MLAHNVNVAINRIRSVHALPTIERYCEVYYRGPNAASPVMVSAADMAYNIDTESVALDFISRIDCERARRASDLLPVTREWFESIGAKWLLEGDWQGRGLYLGPLRLYQFGKYDAVMFPGADTADCEFKTRGSVLHVLKALNIVHEPIIQTLSGEI